jgi:PTS system nitrogen regulatory IIA component
MALSEYLSKERIIADLGACSKNEVLETLAELGTRNCPELDLGRVIEVLNQREILGSTGIGEGVAIPHAKVEGCRHITVALARSINGCNFNAVDGRKCHIFCMLLAPPNAAVMHLSVLAHFVRVFKPQEFRNRFMEAEDEEQIWNLLNSVWKD